MATVRYIVKDVPEATGEDPSGNPIELFQPAGKAT